MIGSNPRFFPNVNLSQITYSSNNISNSNNISINNSLKTSRLTEESIQQYGTGRSSLPDQQFYHMTATMNFTSERKPISKYKNSYMARSNTSRRLTYSPYFHSILTPTSHSNIGLNSFEKVDYSNQELSLLKPMWPLEQFGEYCVELLNRDKHYWTDEQTALMLDLCEENRDHFNDTKTKKTKIWNNIANILNKKFNTSVNAEQCSQKYRNLKAEYLKVADSSSEDSGAKKFGTHFKQMKRLLEVEGKSIRTNSGWVIKDEVIDTSDKFDQTQEQIDVKINLSLPNIEFLPSSNNSSGATKATSEKLFTGNNENLDVSEIASNFEYHNLQVAQIIKQRFDSESSGASVTSEITNEIAGDDEEQDDLNSSKVDVEQINYKSNSINNLKDTNFDNSTLDKNENYKKISLFHSIHKNFFKNSNKVNNVENLNQSLGHSYDNISANKIDNHQNQSNFCAKNVLKISYSEELSSVFHEYFLSRQREFRIYEMKQKENINCMNKHIEAFRQALK